MRTDAVDDDSARRNKRKEDQFMKVSVFLDQFHSHFLPASNKKSVINARNGEATDETTEDSVGAITTSDLEEALAFRSLLGRGKKLEEEIFVVGGYGRSEGKPEQFIRQLISYKDEELKSIQREIQATPDRTKLILSILRRFEVWTSKLIAQDQLVTSTRLLREASKIKADQCCFSPFLNVPSSKYFAKLLPSIDVEDQEQITLASQTAKNAPLSQSLTSVFHGIVNAECCTLALPPNKHTWEAYARLAIMASLIGDDELSGSDPGNGNDVTITSKKRKELSLIRCLKSPTCLCDLNRRQRKGKNPSLNHQYSFSPSSDLVPLWIRAQRNTRALRQFILLFELSKEGQARGNDSMEDKPETCSEPRGGTDKGDTARYKALFRGNPNNVRGRVSEINEHLDHLIEWAVINQSLFTYKHMKERILFPPLRRQQKPTRKRQREVDDFSHRTIISKKTSHDMNGKQNLFELHQACQSYLLRWFARRNRSALTILFSKRIENMTLDIGCSADMKVCRQAEPLRGAGIPSAVQKYMQNLQNGKFYPEDRTFSRIDRRLYIKDRYNGTSPINCQSQVSILLKALSQACSKNQKDHQKLVSAAEEDLEYLFKSILPTALDDGHQDDVYRAALKLVNPSKGCTESSLIEMLKSAPAPWVEKCCRCEKAGSVDLLTCTNCEQVFHEKCSSSSSGSKCTTVALRDIIQSFPPLRDLLKLKQPQNLKFPDFSTSENQWVKKTIQIERKTKDDGKVRKLGISFDHTEDCLKALEAIESDACSLVELMQSKDNDLRGNYLPAPARITHKGCLIREVHKELCGGRAGLQIGDIIICVEILNYAHVKDEDYYGGQRKFDLSDLSSKDRLALLKVESLKLNLIVLRPPVNIVEIATTWYTGTKRINKKILDVFRGMNSLRPWYCGSCIRSESDKEPKSVFREAAYCRAVIRRIGMESYARPFREGNQTCESSSFCLRRLDSIMTHIMRVESKNDFYDFAPESFFAPRSFNFTPQRLAWATEELESRPMELLCEAMKSLLNSSFPGKSHLNTSRSALFRHFLLAFGSWCIGGTVKSERYSQFIGPPDVFKHSRAPWFEATCSVCYSQPTTSQKTFNNNLCSSCAFRDEPQGGTIDREEVEKTGNAMKQYSKNASLVGKSFLVVPTDPLVAYVSRIVHIEHENRPVEFVVASYLPSGYYDAGVKDRQKDRLNQFDDNDGIYHLLPVVSSRQQLFLLERCKMRYKNQKKGDNGCSWTSLNVLNLDGVARYSPMALRNKMKESDEIRRAIDLAFVQKVFTSTSVSPYSFKQISSYCKNSTTRCSSFEENNALEIQDKLLETVLKGRLGVEAVRQLSNIARKPDPSDTVPGDEDRSKWRIVQRGGNSDFLEFGVSCSYPGLLPVNPDGASWKIMRLHNLSREKCLLYYSDLIFQDEVGKEALLKKLHPPNLSHPSSCLSSRNGALMTFTLSPTERNDFSTDIFGWGFEILRWENEQILRVGRMKRESPAWRVGLKTHDIVDAIDGVRITRFRDLSSLVSSILGASNVKVRMPRNLIRYDEISVLLSTMKSAKLKLSPVTFLVVRPRSIDNKAVRSAMSNPRSETTMTPYGQCNGPSQKVINLSGIGGQSGPPSSHPTGMSSSRSQTLLQPRGQRNVPPQRNIELNGGGSQGRPPPLDHAVVQMTRNISTMNQALQKSFGPPTANPAGMLNSLSETLAQPHGQRGVSPQRNIELNGSGRQSRPPSLQPAAVKMTRSFSAMIQILRKTYNDRPPIRKWDFYRPAKNGTILTLLEVSVFLESLMKGTWKLGIRLLMPRYEMRTISEQIKKMFSWSSETLVRIPIVEGDFYQNVLVLDYERTNCKEFPETGPIILVEKTNGVEYKYKCPRIPLPIDRSIEIQFDKDSRPQQQQWNPFQQQSRSQHPAPYYYGYNNNYQHGTVNNHQPPWGDRNRDQGYTLSSHARVQDTRSVHHRHDVVDLAGEEDGISGAFEPALSTDEPSLLLMHNNEISNFRANANQEHAGVPSQRPSSRNGHYTERIRGGGGSDIDVANNSTTDDKGNYLYLCDVPRNQWKGLAVYTFVQTVSQGSACDDALLIGFARRHIEDKSRAHLVQDKVEVEAHYLSGTGYFEETKMHELDCDEVWVVNPDQDCEEAIVIANLRSQNKLPNDYREDLQRATLKNALSNDNEKLDEQEEKSSQFDDREGGGDGDGDGRDRPQSATSDGQQVGGNESTTIATSCTDALRLPSDRTPSIHICEEEHFGTKSSVEYRSGCTECSLCSLPFERYLNCKNWPSENKENNASKPTSPKSLGCSLMSDAVLVEGSSRLDGNIPGQLGEGKTLLLKIAGLIPASLKLKGLRSEEVDPLLSFRVFDNDENYTTWKTFVAECTCTGMLAQALVALIASIKRTKLPHWWSHRDAGWSTAYATMNESNLSALYLHLYVLDAALSDILSRSLTEKSDLRSRSIEANAVQNQRMNNYWDRAMTQGYKAFEGNHKDKCYHCDDGGHLLCCELCPNVQHHECCDPKLNDDLKLDHWLCDSCIVDIENYEKEDEAEEFELEDGDLSS
jgi:hypothetical protein